MIDLHGVVAQMAANADAIRALVHALPEGQLEWRPDPETWSMASVMAHLYNEERMDFRHHLMGMFDGPAERPSYTETVDCIEALERFLEERGDSVRWLMQLESPDWAITTRLDFGPEDTMTISSGELLLSWLEHDYLHMRQMVALLHSWNVARAGTQSLQYAGGW